jgi:small GTP-binding protein
MADHVDSGKTTRAEAMLYTSGAIRKLGRVDHGDAFLDTHAIEKKRGITVFSKQAVMEFGGAQYTLLDTPGHVDFSAETERTFSVLDAAVLVISGSDGVQSHTETLWELLRKYNVPVFVFVNKTDISPFGHDYILSELKRRLSDSIIDFSAREETFNESLSLCSEELMNEYLESSAVSDDKIAAAVMKREVYPCIFGSALKLNGIDKLLDVIGRCTTEPQRPDKFGARVYKITTENGTRLVCMKVTGGTLKVKSTVVCGRQETAEKVDRIRIYSGLKYKTTDEAPAGTLCAVEGLASAYAGEGLGCERDAVRPFLEPVLSYRVICPDGVDAQTVFSRMKLIGEEDPSLHLSWNDRLKEIRLDLMGEIQLEIIRSLISERFGFDVSFDEGSIAYKETIASKVEGVGHYEPLRHYAEVHLIMEPLPQGSGLVFECSVSEDRLAINWQRLILTHLGEKAHLGVLTGSPITDMKITVAGGRAHLKHTEGGDFRQATYRAVRMGLMSAESILLEPYYDLRIELPDEFVGRAMGDLQRLGASFSQPQPSDCETGFSVITGSAPIAKMRGYQTELAGYSKGRGRLSVSFSGFFPCKDQDSIVSEIGYNAESDTDNTADSVFCAHGAGFVVKWNEVPQYMHLPSVLSPKKPDIQEDKAPIRRSSAVSYDDKELMAIFERTYGKIKRDPRSAMVTEKKHNEKEYVYKPVNTGEEYLLVDGYNIIFAWDELSSLARDNLELARNTLINAMCNYRGFTSCNLILVFDAYRLKGNTREIEEINGITVIYTKEAETADMYIEKASHELSKKHRVRVATSDRLEQIIIMGSGAYRMSASEFHDEVMKTEREIRDIIFGNKFI